jgi:hypothetical protein
MGKSFPITYHEGPEGTQRYSSTLSLTSTLDWGLFTPGKDPISITQEARSAPAPVWRVQKTSPSPELDPRHGLHKTQTNCNKFAIYKMFITAKSATDLYSLRHIYLCKMWLCICP